MEDEWRLLQPGKSERLDKPDAGVKPKPSLLRTLPCSTKMEDECKFMPLLIGKGVRGTGSIEPGIHPGQAIWLVTFGKIGGGPWYGERWLENKDPGGTPAILTANVCPSILHPFK